MSLSRQDTSVLKGIAILAMLLHHLYRVTPPDVAPYTGLINWVGLLGKVCVAIFLFCSGYGLATQFHPTKLTSDVRFVLRRLTKFYLNYWVIFIIFVPISVFLFERPLSEAYGENVNIAKSFVFDILGIQGIKSYNITWWFNKLIIILYLLFPIFYRLIRLLPWFAILLGMLIMRFAYNIPYNPADVCTWQFPFVIGIVWKIYETRVVNIQKWLENHKAVAISLSLTILVAAVLLRMYPVIPNWSGIRMDAFLTCAIVLTEIYVMRGLPYVMNVLVFMGKHSMNIYMTHTFLNCYWFKDWLHNGEFMRGGGNFFILMLACLAISIVIEYIKEKAGIYKLSKYLTDKITE